MKESAFVLHTPMKLLRYLTSLMEEFFKMFDEIHKI